MSITTPVVYSKASLSGSSVRAPGGSRITDRPFYLQDRDAERAIWYHRAAIGFLVFIALMCFLAVSEASYQDEVQAAEFYCQQVDLYQSTDGRQGHPDYEQIWAEHCPATGAGS